MGIVQELLAVSGLALITAGMAMWSLPLGVVVAGIAVTGTAVLWSLADHARKKPRED